jgi:hypothetical protein
MKPVPRCYLLTVSSGSSLDQHSNNVTLFNLVEQLNVPADAPPPGTVLPLEIHAYFHLSPKEVNEHFELRFAMVASTGLETCTDPSAHRSVTPRYRTRTMGLPLPPVTGHYELRVDWREAGTEGWQREPVAWPITIVEASRRPPVTH